MNIERVVIYTMAAALNAFSFYFLLKYKLAIKLIKEPANSTIKQELTRY